MAEVKATRSKFITEVQGGDGWTRWIEPVMDGYKLACCDCGLVHNMEFKVESDGDNHKVLFRASRDARSTGQRRRYMRG